MSEEKRVASVLELARMCAAYDSKCFGCPINKGLVHHVCPQDIGEKENEAILKWCDEHPQKTYAQDFFEKFPKAKRFREKDGREHPEGVCRIKIFGLAKEDIGCLDKSCSSCWNEIMTEETK